MAMANMGLRESINSHKGATAGVITVVALIVVAAMAWQLTGSSLSGASGAAGEMYYSTDDGATTFTAPGNLVPPFDRNGKQAVRAVMFSADGGKTRFVGYLERYTPEAKKQIEAAKQAANSGKMIMTAPSRNMTAVEVKKPGDKAWVDKSSAAGVNVTKVAAPNGSTGVPEIVTP